MFDRDRALPLDCEACCFEKGSTASGHCALAVKGEICPNVVRILAHCCWLYVDRMAT